MLGIELEVLWVPEHLQDAQNAGVDLDHEDLTTRKHTFYHVNYILPSDRAGYCNLNSGGEMFSVKGEYDLINAKIKENIVFRWN